MLEPIIQFDRITKRFPGVLALDEVSFLDAYELTAWVPLVVAIVAIGVFPRLVLGATNDAVVSLVAKAFGG